MQIDRHGIPFLGYIESWEDAKLPMAFVDPSQRFQRINHAFEQLLGYSSEEMRDRTWMEFTRQEHIQGDLDSVQAIIEGRLTEYRLKKEYIHKFGHLVPIEIIVRRFPKDPNKPLALFKVEAPIEHPTRQDLRSVDLHATNLISELKRELQSVKSQVVITNQMSDNQMRDKQTAGDNNSGFDQIGHNKNSDASIKILAVCMVAMFLWFMYYVSATVQQQPVQPPPSFNQQETDGQTHSH